MPLLLWFALLLVAFVVLLYVNPRARKQVLITTTYISLTGWYYYRKWEKKHAGSGGGQPASSSRAKSRSSNAPRSEAERESDVVYFEPADKALVQQLDHGDVDDSMSQQSVSETSFRLSETSSSGQSEDPTGKHGPPKTHLGVFRKLRKSHREEKRRARDALHADGVKSEPLGSSRVSEVSTTASGTASSCGVPTRRTFSGRKKPATWGD